LAVFGQFKYRSESFVDNQSFRLYWNTSSPTENNYLIFFVKKKQKENSCHGQIFFLNTQVGSYPILNSQLKCFSISFHQVKIFISA